MKRYVFGYGGLIPDTDEIVSRVKVLSESPRLVYYSYVAPLVEALRDALSALEVCPVQYDYVLGKVRAALTTIDAQERGV